MSQIARNFIYGISLCVLILIMSRHFFYNADYANSSIVWREFVKNGFYALHDWKPTSDSWYFTVYPVNFFIFYIFGDDGFIPLIISSAIYSWVVVLVVGFITSADNDKINWLLSVCCLTVMHETMFTEGFMTHPFAHNSTNAFGFIAILLCIINKDRNSILITTFVSFICLLATSSDMWMAPAFFLPIIISEFFLILTARRSKSHIAVLLIFFALSISHVLPRYFNIASQDFKIANIDDVMTNIFLLCDFIGKNLNIFVIDNNITRLFSFIFWSFVFLCSTWSLMSKKDSTERYIIILCTLSIAGISSSYIISNPLPSVWSSRFLINILPMSIIIFCNLEFLNKRRLKYIPLLLLFIGSLLSFNHTRFGPFHEKTNSDKEYIDFLIKHDLYFGYGDFWSRSMTINWISNGKITILPMRIRDYGIDYKNVRWQTMRSWSTDEYRKKSPSKQFIAVSKGKECPDVNACVDLLIEQNGKPMEILDYKGDKIMIYNKKLGI
ncbi:TPA: hypothetical protein N8095_000838 [Escherichia coli]|nr:hypothetical protein [Escherichia coli]HBJ0688299.1 hypothetical protein [Escherichia coli]HBV0214017.1 hypothetical protein [Escherichia coli]HCO5123691.1 hypothetical protein [Escherichia coli]